MDMEKNVVQSNSIAKDFTQDTTSSEETKPGQKIKGAKSGCRKLIFVFVMIMLVFIMIAGLALFNLFTKFKTKTDLGIIYSKEDFVGLLSELDVDTDDDLESLCLTCPVLYEGSKNVSVNITDEQASSWLEYLNVSGRPLSGSQIKIEPEIISISTNFSYQGQVIPILIKGNMNKVNENTIKLRIYDLRLGEVSIPPEYLVKIEKKLEDFINRKLHEVDNLMIEVLITRDGYLEFKGTIPEKYRGM